MNRGYGRGITSPPGLWLIQVFIRCFRIWFRFLERYGPKKRRSKLREFRTKMDSIEKDKREVLDKIDNAQGWSKFDAVDEFTSRHISLKDRTRHDQMRLEIQQIREESEALTAIRTQCGEDIAQAIEGYKQYIELHPDSSSADVYLGSALKKAKDWDTSLEAYRESERLSADKNVFASEFGTNKTSAPIVKLLIGSVMEEKGDLTAAIAQYRSIVDGAVDYHAVIVCYAWVHLGNALNEQGNRPEARAAWKQAAKCDEISAVAAHAKELLKANP